MDFKRNSAGDHLAPPPSSPPPITTKKMSYAQNTPPKTTTTVMSCTQSAPPETMAVMNCTQNAPPETTTKMSYTQNALPEKMMSYTQSAPPENTTVMNFTQNDPPETKTVMSFTQSAPTTTVISYTQNAPPESTKMVNYTQNVPTTTMMSYSQSAPAEMTKMMSYTQNAPPATTMMSYTQHQQSLTYFTQQGIRAGYVAPHLENKGDRIQHQPVNMHEAIWREFEKERIREEIIAEEVDRRRMLELEVRRELLMERLSAKQSGEGFSLSSPVMGFPPAFPLSKRQSDLRSVEERFGMSLEDRIGRGLLVSRLGARNEIGRLEIVPLEGRISENPFQQRSVDPKVSAFKPVARSAQPTISELPTPLVPSGEKDKIIFLPKPISGVKRKADTPQVEVVATQPPSLDVPKKKGKEDWSCALCQVSATSERGLNDHLQGKKHKSKEAALREHRTGNFSIGLLSKKPKTINLSEANDKLNTTQMEKPKVELLPHSKSGEEESSSLVISEKEDAKDDVVPSLDHHVDDLEKSADVTKTKKKKKNKKKKFQFWCATCRIGALSEVSMEAHKNGKKHKARLLELSSAVATSDADVENAHTVTEPLQEVEETEAEEHEEVFAAGDN